MALDEEKPELLSSTTEFDFWKPGNMGRPFRIPKQALGVVAASDEKDSPENGQISDEEEESPECTNKAEMERGAKRQQIVRMSWQQCERHGKRREAKDT